MDKWKIKAQPDKVVVSHPSVPSSLVIKIKREIDLVPRWKVSTAQTASTFFAAVALSNGALAAGGIMALLALFLTWASCR